MADEPMLRRGSEGEWVEYLQQLLENAGFSPGPIDGIFGPRTEAAVQEYQGSMGLTVDGIVGPITWGSITGEDPGGGGDDPGGGEGDVPDYLVEAGAPASYSQWTEDQKQAYFAQNDDEEAGGGSTSVVEVAAIEADGDGDEYA